MGREPFTCARWDFTSCSNFSRFFALPVSGSEAVSIRSFFREGRRASASSSFFSTRSALRLAWVSFLSAASGGSSSAVNSSLEGRFGSPSAEPGCFSWGSSAFAASWKRCWYLLPCWCIRRLPDVSPAFVLPASEAAEASELPEPGNSWPPRREKSASRRWSLPESLCLESCCLLSRKLSRPEKSGPFCCGTLRLS